LDRNRLVEIRASGALADGITFRGADRENGVRARVEGRDGALIETEPLLSHDVDRVIAQYELARGFANPRPERVIAKQCDHGVRKFLSGAAAEAADAVFDGDTFEGRGRADHRAPQRHRAQDAVLCAAAARVWNNHDVGATELS